MVADPYVEERPNSRRGTTPYGEFSTTRTWSRDYIARGYESEIDGRDAVAAYLGENDLVTLDECPLKTIVLTDDLHDGDWVFEVNWELKQAPTDTGGGGGGGGGGDTEPPWEYSFDIGISTFKRTRSLETSRHAPEDAIAPDFQGAIGVSKDGVEGVDCADSEGTEEFSVDMNRSEVTPAFRRSIRLLAGKVNSDAFLGHLPGEARFDGARGTVKGNGRVRVTFKVTWRPNEKLEGYDEFFGGGVEFVKPGWRYVWEYNEKTVIETTTGGTDNESALRYPGQRTVAVYVEKVYVEKSFALLQAILDGAGTGTYTPPTP